MSSTEVDDYLDTIEHTTRREDARAAVELIHTITGAEPTLWGTMIGFGRQPYTNADGITRETFAVGLAPLKAALTFYGLTYYGSNEDLLARLGKHTTGKGCVYLKKLADADTEVLTELVRRAWQTNHTP